MLTLVSTADAVPLVGIYEVAKKHPGSKVVDKRQAAKKKQIGTVYFTHEMDVKNSNVSEAAGVLEMHKEHLKKQTHISEHEFAEIAQMLDDEEEPDMHHPLKHAYWNIRQNFDRYLQREMYIGDDPTSMFELNLPTKRRDWPGTMTLIQLGRWQDAIPDGPYAPVPESHAGLCQAQHNLAEPGAGD